MIDKLFLKNIVSEIHKLADPWNTFESNKEPSPQDSSVPKKDEEPRPQNSPVPKNNTLAPVSYIGGYRNPAIMDMQRSLIGLAKDVMSSVNLNRMLSQNPEDQQSAKNQNPFGAFLTSNYMHGTGIPLSSDPKKQNPHTQISAVMDAFSRIGNPKKSELTVDGIWGSQTNAAIYNAYIFASNLLKFVSDLNTFSSQKFNPTSYTLADLKFLESIAKEQDKLDPIMKKSIASQLAIQFRSIQNLWHEVEKHMQNHPSYMRSMSGGLEKIQPSTPADQSTLTSQQLQSMQKTYGNFKVSVEGKMAEIGVADLTSPQAFQEWANNAKINIDPSQIVDQIQKQLPKDQTGKQQPYDLGF